jgi:hypothetical protein
MALVLNGMEVKAVPIKPKEISFDKDGKKEIYVDTKGARVKKVKITGSEFKWVYDDGSVYSGKSFKAIKGKPVKPFSKTTLIDTYDTIDINEMKYLINNELTYMLVNAKLKEQLKEIGQKAWSFKFVNRGFKVHRAVVYYDGQLDRSMMRLFRGDLRKTELSEQEDVEEIQGSDDGVEQMSLDDLEV